jgi:capsid protein
MMSAVAGGYTGGRRDKRSQSSFTPLGNSADADLLPDLSTLRARSRDLVRNAPLAAGALNTAATNIVGTGLMLKARPWRDVLGWTEEQAAAWRRATEREFTLWAESTNCDLERTQNFYAQQDLVLRSTLENGDIFALLPFVPRGNFPYQLAVQLIEADRVCNKDNQRETTLLAGGVQLDANGVMHLVKEPEREPAKVLQFQKRSEPPTEPDGPSGGVAA